MKLLLSTLSLLQYLKLAVGLAQLALGLAQSAVGLAKQAMGLAQPALGVAQPVVGLAQLDIGALKVVGGWPSRLYGAHVILVSALSPNPFFFHSLLDLDWGFGLGLDSKTDMTV